jgi:sugar lactone lactonase YvrE
VDSSGIVYVVDRYNGKIRKLTQVGSDCVVTTLASGFGQPIGIAVDSEGNIYVADALNYVIRKITPEAVVTTLAGSFGQYGTNDGVGGAARFGTQYGVPAGVAVDGSDNIYVADEGNYTIRKIAPGALVTTLAGSAGLHGSVDGMGSASRFGILLTGPNAVAADSVGNVYVGDTPNYTIRKISPAGAVTTLAGKPDHYGSADGIGSTAYFDAPYGLAVDSVGSIYVADTLNNRITKGTPLLQFDPSVGGQAISDGSFHARLIGPFYRNAVVEASPDLHSWVPVTTNLVPPSGLNISVPVATNQQQFFRARLDP